MNAEFIIYLLLAAMILGCGFLSVTSSNIFRSAMYLLFSLVGIAGIYFMLEYEFIAAVQIIVYVGGIVVLIIFSIFLTQQIGIDLPKVLNSRKLFAGLAAAFGFLLTMLQLAKYSFYSTTEEWIEPSVNNIGKQLLNTNNGGYALPFEVVSMLLLAAMIGCIVIALKNRPQES